MRMIQGAVAVLSVLVVASCGAAVKQEATTTITGEVTYRERIALPTDSVIRVELEDVSLADQPSTVLAEMVLDSAGRQVPVPFELVVSKDLLKPGMRYSVGATITAADGRLLWITDTMNAVESGKDDINLGTLVMVRTVGTAESHLGEGWVVEDIDGKGIIDSSRMTVDFAPDGRVSGMATCNRYMGGYRLAGETILFTPFAATEMACAEALMNQEQRFLEILQDVTGYRTGETGALILTTDEGRTITARKP